MSIKKLSTSNRTKRQFGAAMVEYALLLTCISLLSIGGTRLIGRSVVKQSNSVSCELVNSAPNYKLNKDDPFDDRNGGVCGTQNTKETKK